jgi:large subunit ribosomal protein L2
VKLLSGPESQPEVGTLPLSRVPLGTVISCIELRPEGAVIARSAGTFAQ